MSLNSTATKVIYDGDGATTEFPVAFKFLLNAHVRAILQAANGDEIAWAEGTHYTLTGAGEEEGGTLAVVTVPVDYTPQPGEILVIKRAVPETQLTELPLGGTLPSTTIEQMVDLLTMMAQAHSEEIARSVLLKATSQASGIEIPDPEASKFLRWDDAAENLENADIVAGGSIGVPVPVGQGGTSATTAAGARASLGLGDAATRTVGAAAGELPKADQAFVDLASAATTDIGAASSESVRITGTATIASFGTAAAGIRRWLRFADALTLTHDGTSLILPGTASIATAADDTAELISLGAGNWLCLSYKRAKAPAGGGNVVQRVYFEDGEAATGTTLMVHDDTIPQNTEGTEFISGVTITPTSATNRLRIRASLNVAHSAANANLIAALFKDSDADAIDVAAMVGGSAAEKHVNIAMEHEMAAGTASQIEFKIRIGSNSPGTTTFNGDTGSRMYGGAFKSTVIVEEIVP